MHKLVQEATRYGLSRPEKQDEEGLFLQTRHCRLFPTYFQPGKGIYGTNVRSMLDMRSRLANGPNYTREKGMHVEALLMRVSDYLYDRGRWREKEVIDSKVYTLCRRQLGGARHPDTVRSMAELATTYHVLGRYEEAEKMKVEVLALRREILGDKHPDTVESMASLAATYHALGRYEEAEKISRLKCWRYGARFSVISIPIPLRAWLSWRRHYHALGRYEEAEKISVEVLALRREILGNKHPDTVQSMAQSCHDIPCRLGGMKRPRRSWSKCWRCSARFSVTSIPIPSGAWLILAATYHALGRYEEAEKIEIEVLALRREILGDKHPDTVRSMAELATTYHALGRYEEDEKISVEVLALRREILGDKHPNTVQSMADLAATYYALRRYEEAEKID